MKKDPDNDKHQEEEKYALEVSSVVFPVEASRMLLVTREGAVVALGDGCGIQIPHHAVASATSNCLFEKRFHLGDDTEDDGDSRRGVKEGERMAGRRKEQNKEFSQRKEEGEGGRLPSVPLLKRDKETTAEEEKENHKNEEVHSRCKGMASQNEEFKIREKFLLSATATITPRFWVDKSRQQRLYGIEHVVLPPGRRAKMVSLITCFRGSLSNYVYLYLYRYRCGQGPLCIQ